jgi:hypothetical protein
VHWGHTPLLSYLCTLEPIRVLGPLRVFFPLLAMPKL